MENEFMIELLAMLDKKASKKQINADIKELHKAVSALRLTATLYKGESKKEINQAIRQMEAQLNHIRLKAKLDQKNLKSDINKVLNDITFKEIDLVDSGKTKIKVQKIIADAKKIVQNNPISLNIELKKEKLNNQLTTYLTKNTKIRESDILLKEADKLRNKIAGINDRDSLRHATDSFQVTNPHFKWGFIFRPSGGYYWFRQRRDSAVPLLLVTLHSRALYFLLSSNLSFSSCS